MKAFIAVVSVCLFAGLVTTVSAQEGRPAPAAPRTPPPAPAPGSPGIYKSDEELTTVLKAAIARANGAQSASNIATTDQYSVNIVHREKAAGALAHEGNTELHYIIEGTGVVVTGGTIVRGAQGTLATIQNGESHAVKKGDVIIVPAGSAHWYKDVTTPITYLEVRFVAPK